MSDSEKIEYLILEVAHLKQQLLSIQSNQSMVFDTGQLSVLVANPGSAGPFEFAPVDLNQPVLLPHLYVADNPIPGTTFTFNWEPAT